MVRFAVQYVVERVPLYAVQQCSAVISTVLIGSVFRQTFIRHQTINFRVTSVKKIGKVIYVYECNIVIVPYILIVPYMLILLSNLRQVYKGKTSYMYNSVHS